MLPKADKEGWSLEIALDVETVHSVCQNCKYGDIDCEGTTACDAAPGFDGPSGVGAPKGLGAFKSNAVTLLTQTSASVNRRKAFKHGGGGFHLVI